MSDIRVLQSSGDLTRPIAAADHGLATARHGAPLTAGTRSSTNAAENKATLLALAMRGDKRPAKSTRLGSVLCHYLTPAERQHDAVFTLSLRRARPDWFPMLLVASKKHQLLALARSGVARPHRLTALGAALAAYTRPSGTSYDRLLHAELRRLRPRWFRRPRTDRQPPKVVPAALHALRQTVLTLAREGRQRPRQGTPLGDALARCLTEASPRYDPDFTAALRTLRPDWFPSLRAEANRCLLLDLARAGAGRPKRRSPLGNALMTYTAKTGVSRDVEFNAIVRALRPDWFVSDSQSKRWGRNR